MRTTGASAKARQIEQGCAVARELASSPCQKAAGKSGGVAQQGSQPSAGKQQPARSSEPSSSSAARWRFSARQTTKAATGNSGSIAARPLARKPRPRAAPKQQAPRSGPAVELGQAPVGGGVRGQRCQHGLRFVRVEQEADTAGQQQRGCRCLLAAVQFACRERMKVRASSVNTPLASRVASCSGKSQETGSCRRPPPSSTGARRGRGARQARRQPVAVARPDHGPRRW
jgi:hypothetical protein